MGIPGQTLRVKDPGLPVSPPAINSPLMLGTCELGTVNTLYAFSDTSDAVATLGQGPLTEDICTYLNHPNAGGPVYAVKVNGSVAGAAGTVTKVPKGSSTGTVTVAGAAFDAYDVIIEIMKSGTVGAAEFRYTLDGGYTYSGQLPVPSGGTYSVPNTNLTLTFTPGAGAVFFEAGDVHKFTCTAPFYSSTDLNNAIDAAKASAIDFAFMVACGQAATSSAGAIIAAALGGQAAAMFNGFRYVRSIIASGTDVTGTATTSYANFVNDRVNVTYGNAWLKSAKPFAGWSTPKRPASSIVAARAGASLISTSLARYNSGALTEVVKIDHNEALTEVMDQKRFTTLRTHVGVPGFYITNGRLMAAVGSDYEFWHAGRVMDVACQTTYRAQMPFIGASVRVNADGTGTIDARDAVRLEEPVKTSLQVALADPDNAEGTKGHVTAFGYRIDREANVLVSKKAKTKVAVVPLGYTHAVETELGFAVTVGG